MERYREFGREIRRRSECPVAETSGRGEGITLRLPQSQAISHIVLMEDIAHGERVRKYVVEGQMEPDEWRKLCEGTVIGHKHVQQITRQEISAVSTAQLEPTLQYPDQL